MVFRRRTCECLPRRNSFNLTECGKTQSFFIQGGQRWQNVRLLTNTTIVFNSIAPLGGPSDILGKSSALNSAYDKLFNLGGQASHVSCIDAGSAPSTWELTPDGALVRGETAVQSAKKALRSATTPSHSRARSFVVGTGWRVASGIQPYRMIDYQRLCTAYSSLQRYQHEHPRDDRTDKMIRMDKR